MLLDFHRDILYRWQKRQDSIVWWVMRTLQECSSSPSKCSWPFRRLVLVRYFRKYHVVILWEISENSSWIIPELSWYILGFNKTNDSGDEIRPPPPPKEEDSFNLLSMLKWASTNMLRLWYDMLVLWNHLYDNWPTSLMKPILLQYKLYGWVYSHFIFGNCILYHLAAPHPTVSSIRLLVLAVRSGRSSSFSEAPTLTRLAQDIIDTSLAKLMFLCFTDF